MMGGGWDVSGLSRWLLLGLPMLWVVSAGWDSGGASCSPKTPFYIGYESGDCSGNGRCVPSNLISSPYVCECDAGYADPDCSYKRKSKLTAFLLAFFLGGIGAARFYLGYDWEGFAQLFCTTCFCCPAFLLFTVLPFGKCDALPLITTFTISTLVMFCVMQIWWLVDWIIIAADLLRDQNGYDLQEDF
eukprot:TRINITY_DN7837_c0_g1_i3.p1 TRINITY_DN7837_c0_g1~~TRINITY_DN7837_c0_g1_i3.p1  ORF type:complete len:188 (+),score=27.73 TRINITY_DN7837_c0_g1_i3:105-668(+)